MSLNVLRKNLGIYGANTYILYDDNKEAVVIDCGGDADEVEKLLKEHDLRPLALILTHGHFDHIAGMDDLREITGAPIYGCEKERDLFEDAEKNLYNKFVENDKKFKEGLASENYKDAMDALNDLVPSIDAFFDSVMVMAEDENIRHNRLALINSIEENIQKILKIENIVE